jgi:hypothetical protein
MKKSFRQGRSVRMNCKLVLSLATMLLVVASASWAADDGKPAIKAPAVKGTTMDVGQLVDHITKGESGSKAPHNKGIAGLSDTQAKAIAEYIKALK